MAPVSFIVRPANWAAERERLRAIRRVVFIEEQSVPEELEWDESDDRCHHVLALAAGDLAIGTGRLAPDGRIGRMAVLQEWRGKGVGSAILQALLRQAQAYGYAMVRLHAQVHALPFYARHGFTATGPAFLEANIVHRSMHLELGGAPRRPSRPGQ